MFKTRDNLYVTAIGVLLDTFIVQPLLFGHYWFQLSQEPLEIMHFGLSPLEKGRL
nr:hypothetical protein [Tuberibacillus sp. Marseille-P3662]